MTLHRTIYASGPAGARPSALCARAVLPLVDGRCTRLSQVSTGGSLRYRRGRLLPVHVGRTAPSRDARADTATPCRQRVRAGPEARPPAPPRGWSRLVRGAAGSLRARALIGYGSCAVARRPLPRTARGRGVHQLWWTAALSASRVDAKSPPRTIAAPAPSSQAWPLLYRYLIF